VNNPTNPSKICDYFSIFAPLKIFGDTDRCTRNIKL
jgi:hypothetical protein